jgi:hypothetical protein
MTRLRISLLLLTITAILITAMPALAAGGDPGIAAPAAVPGLDLNQCTAPLQAGTPTASLASIIFPNYVICSCELCSRTDVDCRISPSGYSIACADYYQLNCKE